MTVNPIPPNCNSVNIAVVVKDANAAIEFYKKAFDAKGGACLTAPDGSVLHAEVQIGNSTVMLGEENEQWGMISAETMGGSPISIMIYVEDCDAVFQRAVEAGCEVISPLDDQFWGDRHGRLKDPFGYQWGIATHIEDVSEEEIDRRGKAWLEQMMTSESESKKEE